MNIGEFVDEGSKFADYDYRGGIEGIIYVMTGFTSALGACFGVHKKCFDNKWELTEELENQYNLSKCFWYLSQLMFELNPYLSVRRDIEVDNFFKTSRDDVFNCNDGVVQRIIGVDNCLKELLFESGNMMRLQKNFVSIEDCSNEDVKVFIDGVYDAIHDCMIFLGALAYFINKDPIDIIKSMKP